MRKIIEKIFNCINFLVIYTLYMLSRRNLQRRFKPIDLPAGKRILFLSPHVDDEILGAGGSFCKHAQRGDRLDCVYLTDGSMGYHPYLKGDDYVLARKREAAEIGKIVGYRDIYFLDYPDFNLKRDENLCKELAKIIDKHQPDLIYLPFFLDPHPDHAQVTAVLLGAIEHLEGSPGFEVCAYGVFSPLTPWLANVMVDISDVYDRKLKALAVLNSQIIDFAPILDFNFYNSFLKRGAKRVELLLNVSLPEYRKIYNQAKGLKVVPAPSKFKYLYALFHNKRIHGKVAGKK